MKKEDCTKGIATNIEKNNHLKQTQNTIKRNTNPHSKSFSNLYFLFFLLKQMHLSQCCKFPLSKTV